MSEFSELLKTITWEQMLFVFSIVFILVFRKPISEFIPKIKQITKDGLTTESTPESQLEKTNNSAVQELLNVVQNTIVISDLEIQIKNDLSAKNLCFETDTAKVLIRHLAATQLLLSFEQIHGLIFGTQIHLLRKLNEVTGNGRSVDYVEGFIDKAKELNPDAIGSWSYKQYLSFLFDRLLIVQHDKYIHISNLGVEYLIWIARAGKRDDNPI
jgi:hypothetical protein